MSILLTLILLFNALLSCPDLTLDGQRMQRSHRVTRQYIGPNSCAIDECNTGVGNRLLLKFDGAIPNVGTSDLEFGRPATRDGFVWDDCHRHYHFNHFMDYQVFEYDNITYPDPILAGDKRAFCLRDDGFASRTILREYGITARRVSNTFDCDDQGIHVGYQDVYGRDLECQWIDVTTLPAGQYRMRAEVNPIVNGHRRINECGNYGNNVVWIEFTTPGTTTRVPRNTDPTSRPTNRPSNRPTQRPISDRSDDSNDSVNDRRFGSLFDRLFANDDDDCLPIGTRCRFSSHCCGTARCYRMGNARRSYSECG